MFQLIGSDESFVPVKEWNLDEMPESKPMRQIMGEETVTEIEIEDPPDEIDVDEEMTRRMELHLENKQRKNSRNASVSHSLFWLEEEFVYDDDDDDPAPRVRRPSTKKKKSGVAE